MSMPTLTPCESSVIAAHGHNPATQTLYLRFKSGHTYAYPEVSTDLYASLCSAESIGRWYGAYIKGKHEAKPMPRALEAVESEGGEP